MRIEDLNLDIIKEFENCKLIAYKCPAGVWTVGYGSTYHIDGSRVGEDDVVGQDVAEQMLLIHVNKRIIQKLDKDILNMLNIEQLSALCSLIYRIGITEFRKSKLKKAILKRDYKSINNNWDWLGKDKSIHRGLCLRVSKEKTLFFSSKLKKI